MVNIPELITVVAKTKTINIPIIINRIVKSAVFGQLP